MGQRKHPTVMFWACKLNQWLQGLARNILNIVLMLVRGS